MIAELLEEREDYLVQAPPPNSNRRRSAPSPRLQPSVLATHQDFRTWALANGVPHAQGGNLPIFPSSHQLQGTSPLTGDNINGIQNNGLSALNAETLARYQQASQALSQANLQQQQAQQQQLLANLPALLAATNLSRSTRSTPRRFHEHSYKQLRQSGNGGVHGQQQQQGQQNIFGQQLLSPQQAQQVFANNQSFSQSIGHGVHPSKQAFSRSQNVAANNHLSRPPILERRSSWDGSAASDETRQQSYRRGSASVSEAGPGASTTSPSDGLGNAPIDMGTTTAPTSPAMHNGTLPAFASHATYQPPPSTIASPTLSTVSVATAPAGSFNQYAPNQGRDRQNRNQRNQWPSSSSYNPRSPSQTSGIGGQHGKASRYYGSQDDGQFVTGTSIPMQSFPTTLPLATDFNAGALPMDYAARNDLGPSNSSALSTTSTSASLAASPLVNVEAMAGSEERDPIVDDGTIPSPSSIRFGNFDAAFYSSEPSDMAGLGLFDASSSTDGSPLSLSGGPAFDDSIIPEEVELPPPVRLPSQQPANFAASMRAAQRFRPQLADIPASPAAKHVPSPLNKPDLEESTSSRRPSLQSNRRKSAGDEVGLGLGDVTFFGKIPVSKNEGEREKAMAALLKETGRES